MPGTCYGAQTSLDCQAQTLVEPAAGVTSHLLWTGIPTASAGTPPGLCATHSQVGYLIDAATGKSLSIYLFQRTGGDTEYTEHVLFDASHPGAPWEVRLDVKDTGPAGYAGGLTKTVYPVVCFY